MTQAANDRRAQYTATGGQTVFARDFLVDTAAEVNVWQNDTLLVNPTNYTMDGLGAASGDVTLVVGATLNDRITIEGVLAVVRSTDFQTSNFKSATLNIQFDDTTRLVQELDRDRSRSAILNGYLDDAVDATLPDPVALRLLSWDADAEALVNVVNTGSSDAVAGPVTVPVTADAVALFDGTTGRLLKASLVTITSGAVTGVTTLNTSGLATMQSALISGLTIMNGGFAMTVNQSIYFITEADGGTTSDSWFQEMAARKMKYGAIDDGLTGKQSYMEITRGATDANIDTVSFPNGDVTIAGIITAGSGAEVLTNVAGTIKGSAFEAAIAGAGINLTAGVLSAVAGGAVDPADITTVGAVLDDVLFFDGANADWGSLATIQVDLTTDVTGILPDANVAEDLTLDGATIDNSPIGAVTATTGRFTTVEASSTLSLFGGIVQSVNQSISVIIEADGGTVSDTWFQEMVARTMKYGAINDDLTGKQSYLEITRGAADAIIDTVSIPNGDFHVDTGDVEVSAGTVHIISGSSGATANVNADELVIEGPGQTGVHILAPDVENVNIFLGHPSDAISVRIRHIPSSNLFQLACSVVGDKLDLAADAEVSNITLSGILGSERAEVHGLLNFTGTLGSSTVDPSTHGAPDDWLEVEIGGTSFFIPAYNAT